MRIYFDNPIPIDKLRQTYSDAVTFISTVKDYPNIIAIEVDGDLQKAVRRRVVPLDVRAKLDRIINKFKKELLNKWEASKSDIIEDSDITKFVKRDYPFDEQSFHNWFKENLGIDISENAEFKHAKWIYDAINMIPKSLIKGRIKAIVLDNRMGKTHRRHPNHGRWEEEKKVMRLNPDAMYNRRRSLQLITHEIGHCIDKDNKFSESGDWLSLSGWTKSPPGLDRKRKGDSNYTEEGDYKRLVIREEGTDTLVSNWWHHKNARFPRWYGERNPGEDFAEVFSHVVLGDEDILEGMEDKVAFIRSKVLNKASRKLEKQVPDEDEEKKRKAKVTRVLKDLSRTFGLVAPAFLEEAFRVGKERGQGLTGQPLDDEISDSDREGLLEIIDENTDFFDNFITEDLREALLESIEGDYPTEDDYFESIEQAMDSNQSRLLMYALTALTAFALGFVSAAKEADPDVGETLYEGGFWRTYRDDRVCSGCEENDGKWMTLEEFLDEYQNNECLTNCRCGELFELAAHPEEAGE